MKKILLGLAVMLGIATSAYADTWTWAPSTNPKLSWSNGFTLKDAKVSDKSFQLTATPLVEGKAVTTHQWNGNSPYGLQIGSKSAPATVNVKSSGFENNKISEVRVKAYAASQMLSGEVNVKVGDTNFTCTAGNALKNQSDYVAANTPAYVFTGDATGEIDITINQKLNETAGKEPGGSIYVAEVTVTYADAPAPVEYTYTVDPAAGEVASLEQINITFNVPVGGKMIDAPQATITTPDGTKDIVGNAAWDNPNLFLFHLGKAPMYPPVTTPGDYTLKIPAGYFALNGKKYTDEGLSDSPEIIVKWTIKGTTVVNPVELTTYMVTPDTDADAKEYWEDSIAVQIEAAGKWGKNSECTSKAQLKKDGVVAYELSVNDPMVMVQAAEAASDDATSGSTGVILVFSQETGATDGKYELVIPEGFLVRADDAPNKEYTKSWQLGTVAPPVSEITYTVDPQEGVVTSLGKVNITFNVPVDGFVSGNYDNATLKKPNGDVENVWPDGYEGNSVAFDFRTTGIDPQPITTPGEYVLTIPAGKWSLNGFLTGDEIWDATMGNSPAMTITWKIEAVTLADPVAFNVLDIQPDGVETSVKEAWKESIMIMAAVEGTWEKNPTCKTKAWLEKDGNLVYTLSINDEQVIIESISAADGAAANGSTQVVLVFSPNKGATDGNYELIIPEGFLVNSAKAPNAKYTHTWKVSDETPEAISFAQNLLTIQPDDNSEFTASALWEEGDIRVMGYMNGKLTVNPNCKNVIKMMNGDQQVGVAISVKSGEENLQVVGGTPDPGEATAQAEEPSMFGLTFATLNKAPQAGTYTMTIPEGFFYLNGQPLSSYSKSWTIAKVITGEFGVTPEDGSTLSVAPQDYIVEFPSASAVTVSGTIQNVTVTNGTQTYNAFGIMPISGNSVTFFLSGTPGEGNWTVTVPANTFSLDGTPYDKEIVWSFTIKYPSAPEVVSVSPAPGEVQPTDLKEIRLTYPLGSNIVLGEEGTYMVTLTGVTASTGMSSVVYTASVQDNVIVFTNPSSEPLELGKYNFEITRNVYTIDGFDNPTAKYEYTVVDNSTKKYTINTTPANGASVATNELLDIIVEVEDATTVTATQGKALSLVKGDTKIELTGWPGTSANQVAYMMSKNLEAGEWTATLPEGALTIDGEMYNEVITWNFTVTENQSVVTPKPTANPAEGEVSGDQLNRIVLTLAEGQVATLGEEGTAMIQLVDLTTSWGVRFYNIALSENGNQIILTAQGGDSVEPLAVGDYRLDVYGNSYFINGEGNSLLTYSYKVTTESVEGIYSDDTEFNVYTATGICVIRNGKSEDVKLLPAGLYIINGKTVMIRK
ncbi:MAG: hypothetical protein NC194_04850 [Prevotella sp.]|nr:hypothetical protein [Prevotella sp.]